LFNGILPFNINIKIYFPDLFSLEESEARFLFKQFLTIHSNINQYNEIKQKMKMKKHNIKRRMNTSKMRYRRR
jgi:hypothetical protein